MRPTPGKSLTFPFYAFGYTLLPSEFLQNSFFDLFTAFSHLLRYACSSQKGDPLALALAVSFSLPLSISFAFGQT